MLWDLTEPRNKIYSFRQKSAQSNLDEAFLRICFFFYLQRSFYSYNHNDLNYSNPSKIIFLIAFNACSFFNSSGIYC